MISSRRIFAVSSVLAATQLLLAGTATAQSTDATLQEIIVTATRREESLSKVPISISAYTQQTLDDRSVRTVDDIARLTPGVQFDRANNSSSGVADISIRGISSPSAGSGATGIYIDDTPIQARMVVQDMGSSVFPAIFDLERVEILRGPQGTLFGAGSEGGTVRFITPQPSTTQFSNYSRAELGFTQGGGPSFEAGTALNVPLSENRVGLRVSASYRRDGGYVGRIDIHNLQLLENESNWSDTKTFRAALAFQATDALTITPSLYYQDQWFNDSSVYWEGYTDPVSGDYTAYSNPGKDVFNRGTLLANSTADHFLLPALKIDWNLGAVKLISNTSYFDRDQHGISDLSSFEADVWAGNPIFPQGMYAPSYNATTQQTFTQEVRLQSQQDDSRFSWVVGAFYQHAKQHHHERVEDIFLPDLFFENTGEVFEDVFPGGMYEGKYTVKIDPVDTVDKQLALFGQVNFKITDRLTAIVGARYARTDFSIHAVYAGPIVGPIADDRGSKTANPVTPKFGLSWQMTDDTLLYASASKGFRTGGYNNPVAAGCGISTTGTPIPGSDLGDLGLTNRPPLFDDDTVWSYELGGKMRALGGRLQIDASVYQIDWNNIQFGYNLPHCGFSFTTNAGSAKSHGFELELHAQPADPLTLGLAIGYVNAKYTETVFAPSGALTAPPPGSKAITSDGDRIVVSPWTVSFTGQWKFDVLEHDSYFRLNYDYRAGLNSKLPWNNPQNGSYDPNIGGPDALSDLSLKLGTHVGRADIALFANNLTNQHPVFGRRHWTVNTPLYVAATVRPRTVGVTATYRY
jgi:outer membrane receptor protein involved in Fe transport